MDAGLRRHLLAMLKVDLELADNVNDPVIAEMALIGPKGFERVAAQWTRRDFRLELLVDALTRAADVEVERYEGGGIITCPCQCHLPIGPPRNFVGLNECEHCRLLAAAA